ncbi:TonB-dependent receptor [Janthinobacterium agaricidamnosum]|uniref:TonB-dependent Receptor Plug domain protein n=1 Tax=Janthinobacterium agaricidamnosum NBRC 102515 = DSM 9628 TaxID=1349767 RepID=W0VED7_9BURK|nr:TonB-dependent receptor [Janthinobacterium agaricidamnosum]CDG86055.1 tonB-dependent Receptor Plug domain protein [Janthinobacterium agaricidamnosum NBRC 102515 = DSM 9628]
MQHTPQLSKLTFAIASLFAVSAAYADPASATAPTADTVANADSAPAPDMQRIEVTAAHLKSARIDLSPKVGTTVYSIDTHMVNMLGQGDNTPFNEVLLRLPGVAQDSKGSGALHVRDDHGNVQYRINGVQLPESITGFGQSIDTRLIDRTDFMTGALPAQFGLRTAGVIDIETKEGGTKPGGRVGVLVGSNNHVEPSAEFFGSQGNFNYYLSGSYLGDSLGVENPQNTRSAIHDKTRQSKSFGNLSYFLDDTTRLGLMFGTYNGRFQIPNNPDQAPGFSLAGKSDVAAGTSSLPSSQLDENQREVNRFLVLSLQKTLGDLNYQISAFHQYSELHFTPDAIGDLIYNGVSTDSRRSNTASGTQLDVSYKLNPQHTVRGGLAYTRQKTTSDNTVNVFTTGDDGAQNSTIPTTIVDNGGKTGTTSSLYLQDEWHISAPLTLNYGVRFDKVSAYTDEQQWSPRLNLAYQLSPSTALHAGYSRYFTPPPQELAAQSSIDLYANTTNAPEVPKSDNVKAERTHYYDIGLSHQVNSRLTLTADAYYKKISNLLDEGQFGQALILSPFNYAEGYAKGLELSGIYSEKNWGAFLNLTAQKAQGRNIVSGQALFGVDELAYIATHDIYLDHDQTYTVSGGAHYHFGDSQVSADFLYGSGLRKTPDGAAPNSGSLPQYFTVNTALTHTWKNTPLGKVEGRLALINLFDKSYLLRDGSGVGVGAPQYGARRSFYAGLSTSF